MGGQLVGYTFADKPDAVVSPDVKGGQVHELWVLKPGVKTTNGFTVKNVDRDPLHCETSYAVNYARLLRERDHGGYSLQIVVAEPGYCIDELKPKSP